MSDEKEPKPKKKGGKMKLILMIVGGIAVLGGGGVAAGMYVGGGHDKKEAEDADKPKLVPREGSDEHGAPAAGHGKGAGGIDPRKYQASYYPIEQSFTANLADSDGFVQVSLGVSTFYDQKVLDNLKANDMPIRSAVLMTLADQDPDSITTPAGKKALQHALKDAINTVLVNREGFGGVDDVYFTSFVIQ